MKKVILILAFLFILPGISAASMASYCAVPPFLGQAVTPNVLFIVDNSGSMKYPAYWPSDLHLSATDTSFNPDRSYYGIFDSNSNYSYDSNGKYFYKDSNGDWSGNFLNWLTMRRYDILLKVLMGGNYKKDKNGNKYLQGFNVCEYYYKKYMFKKKYDNSGYFPSKYLGKTFYVGKDRDGNKKTRNDRYWFKVKGKWYAIRVKIDRKPAGLLQGFSSRLRLGLMVFNHGAEYEDGDGRKDGGHIVSYITDNNTSLADMFLNQDVYNHGFAPLYPHMWTPLGETMYEAVRYFEATKSAYNSGVDYSQHDPIKYWCQKNFVILITDGEATKDKNLPGTYFDGHGSPVQDDSFNIKTWMDKIADNEGYSSQWDKDYSSDGTYYLEGVSYYAHVTDLRSDISGKQNLTLYTIYTFGKNIRARDLLKKAAKYGGFYDLNGDNKPDETAEWDRNGDGVPDNYYEAQNGEKLEDSINEAFANILRSVSSGTSPSLQTQNGISSLLFQAVFYPKKTFLSYNVDWIGYLYAWWMYFLPYATDNSFNYREDTIQNKILDICNTDGTEGGDYILEYTTDTKGNLKINKYKSMCSGDKDNSSKIPVSSFDSLIPVWDAGEKLKEDSDPKNNRIIYVNVDNSTPDSPQEMVQLKNLNVKYSYMLGDENKDGIIDDSNEDVKLAKFITFDNLVNYIYGVDISGYRSRQTGNGVWKLGDIIYSTPKIVNYDNYSVVYVGANDGMLHAFLAGYKSYNTGRYQDARISDNKGSNDSTNLGKELWAFIPKNALPYLRFLSDPSYCHLYYVDLTPFIIRLDTNNDGYIDKIILIGGMRLGGGVGCKGEYCVNPPADTCDNTSDSNCIGLSSYFALDITSPTDPKLLWEFTNKDLGFTYSGPAFIEKEDESGSWHRYIMFVSGPTDYRGFSGQSLKIFILTLNENMTIKNIIEKSTDFNDSFGGRLFTFGVTDENGQTKAVFFGVTQRNSNGWQGNVLEIKTDSIDPDNWKIYKLFNNPIGPVTSKISYMKCFNKDYIYFGTGRYFYKDDDDPVEGGVNKLYGVNISNCLKRNNNGCAITNVYARGKCNLESNNAWYVSLDNDSDNFFRERDYSDPTTTYENFIVFTTAYPTSDICGHGGNTSIFALNCATGESLSNQRCSNSVVVNNIRENKMIIQTSIGGIFTVSPKKTNKQGKVLFDNDSPTIRGLVHHTSLSIRKNIFKILYRVEH